MKKAQGSLEYLLILAAILAIAVVVVVVANTLMAAPKTAAVVEEDKYTFATNGVELVSYSAPFSADDPGSLPAELVKGGDSHVLSLDSIPGTAKRVGSLTDASGEKHDVYIGGSSYYVEGVSGEMEPEECSDNDGDGYGDPASGECTYPQKDCDDSDSAVHPGATEVCTDEKDNDCDGKIDCADTEDCSTHPACEVPVDNDDDGYTSDVDCDDTDPAINPGAAEGMGAGETCFDGKDNDCDGDTDCDDSECGVEISGMCHLLIGECGYEITTGGYYTLSSNLACTAGDGVRFGGGSSGATLNCNNKQLSGSGGGNGIYVTGGAANARIKNCVVTSFNYGVYIQGNNARVEDSNFANNQIGAYVTGAVGPQFMHNSFTMHNIYGIRLESVPNFRLDDNDIMNSGNAGVVIGAGSSGGTLRLNNIDHNQMGVEDRAGGNTYSDNVLQSNWYGIFIGGPPNTLNNNRVCSSGAWDSWDFDCTGTQMGSSNTYTSAKCTVPQSGTCP
ncbi:MAG: right-handed parallel beta-helix repeat-containing protein [Candidatus Diapherotrites archaeon]|nr:right-handed parallel beta-helix repeat-containing protein [Candidatus Diapherotrites archaeon]